MRKLLIISIALLASCLTWAQPTVRPKAPKYISDKDLICSYNASTIWFGAYSSATVSAFTCPWTGVSMNYMHMSMPKDGYTKNDTSYDFSGNGTEYLHFEIWTDTDTRLSLKLAKASNGTDLTVSLKGGKWNVFDYNLVDDLGATTLNGVGFVRFKALDDDGADIYVDNYYFHHNVLSPTLTVGSPNADGVAAVTGILNAQSALLFLDEIQDEQYKDIVLYDFNSADYSEYPGENAFKTRWKAANPNAVFVVKWVADSYINRFSNKTNVGFLGTKKFYPKGDVEFVDGYDILHPTYNIGTLPDGKTISYTRKSISGIATTILPFDADVPDGVKAYEFSSVDGSVLKFSEVTEMSAFTPYIIEGSSLEVSSSTTKNNIVLKPEEVDVAGIAKFTGTFQTISATTTTADDNKFVLTAGGTSVEFKKSHGKIGAFRAFLKYTAASSRQFSVVFDDEATGVRPATMEELETLFNVYSIDGRQVKSKADTLIDMPAGIYVINGKKVVIK